MKVSAAALVLFVWLVPVASAQTTNSQILNTLPSAPTPASNLAPAPDLTRAFQPATPAPFRSFGQDLTGFFSTDTAKVVGLFAVAGLVAHPHDHGAVEPASRSMSKGTAGIGTWGGSFYLQTGAAFATYAIGLTTSNSKLASFGGDLVRAQLLSQTVVQATKFAIGRERPDGSNSHSFPSGHSASAFATATVVQRHFGWKAGVPAYAFAGFVATSRMASTRHYLSDVLVGAGVGIAAGRTVTVHMGRQQFDLGAAPTRGGAMVTFTKR
jgi:membrane-associated phospholipid phosphatase